MEEAFEEGQGPHGAVEPVMMMMIVVVLWRRLVVINYIVVSYFGGF
jgi:hypothetical protein